MPFSYKTPRRIETSQSEMAFAGTAYPSMNLTARVRLQPGPDEVRRLVLQTLQELGAPVPGLANLEETIID
jgi:hypothetical protein